MRGPVLLAQATGDEPAGGAAALEALGATAGALAATALVVVLIAGHRTGRTAVLGRAAAFAERQTGLPGWAALPTMLVSASLLVAVLGMYWDISLHIDNGRDAGPLATSFSWGCTERWRPARSPTRWRDASAPARPPSVWAVTGGRRWAA